MPQKPTKTRGLEGAEERLRAARAELRTARGTGVLTGIQEGRLKDEVAKAQNLVARQTAQQEERIATGKELRPARGRPRRRTLTEVMRSRGTDR